MLYLLFYPLHKLFSFLNILRYITFRAAMAALTAFILSLLLGPWLIRTLKARKIGEKIGKEDSRTLDELHRHKQDTPTMGGVLIILAVGLATLLWADISQPAVLICLLSVMWLGLTGLADDYLKQIKKRPKGLTPRVKLASQLSLGGLLGWFVYVYTPAYTTVDVPFLKEVSFNLGIGYIFFAMLVIASSSNAVNLTDGLDGLAIGIVVMVAIAFSILSYISGNIKFSNYLFIPYVPAGGELTVFCASIIGAGLGFLWFNCYPAAIFMGDVGSLALGGAIGTVAILIKKELLLIIVGGIFVAEALSVILQVASYKLTKKRIFKIAPLHHHFQFLGWPESKVIVRFWIIASLLALFTLVTLKIR